MTPEIGPATSADADAIWTMLEPVFRAGETYAVDPAIGRAEALEYWCGPRHRVFLARDPAGVLGSYYLKANQAGGGGHVANAAFVTAPAAQGRGVARAMLDHALAQARTAGFTAMQFNFVVSTNTRAVDLWRRAGFQVVGRLPGAFVHPRSGHVDALVMYLDL